MVWKLMRDLDREYGFLLFLSLSFYFFFALFLWVFPQSYYSLHFLSAGYFVLAIYSLNRTSLLGSKQAACERLLVISQMKTNSFRMVVLGQYSTRIHYCFGLQSYLFPLHQSSIFMGPLAQIPKFSLHLIFWLGFVCFRTYENQLGWMKATS